MGVKTYQMAAGAAVWNVRRMRESIIEAVLRGCLDGCKVDVINRCILLKPVLLRSDQEICCDGRHDDISSCSR